MTLIPEIDPAAEMLEKQLRDKLIQEMISNRILQSEHVISAFSQVSRPRYYPEESLESHYSMAEALVTRRRGETISSSISAPWVHVRMLEFAQLHTGQRVLEVGSGGCNAELVARIVGDTGSVTSTDIDPEVIENARSRFPSGLANTDFRVADAWTEEFPAESFDRVMITVDTPYIPQALFRSLRPEGIMLAPMNYRGISVVVSLVKTAPEVVEGSQYFLAGFLLAQGVEKQSMVRLVSESKKVYMAHDGSHSSSLKCGLPSASNMIDWTANVAMPRIYECSLYVATHDRRFGTYGTTTGMPADDFLGARPTGTAILVDGDSYAFFREGDEETNQYPVVCGGAAGAELGKALVAHVETCHETKWTPRFSISMPTGELQVS